MAGAITQHAQFRLAQLTTLASESAADVDRLQKDHDTATERFAQGLDSFLVVSTAKENLERAQAHKQGSENIRARFAAKMADSAYQQLLADADQAEEEASALDFAAAWQPMGERVERAATDFANMIGEALRIVDNHVQTQNALTLASERAGFGELYRRPPIDIETGLARFREAMERGLRAASVPEHFIRGATGIRL